MTRMTKQKLASKGIYNLVPLQNGEEYYPDDPDIYIDSLGRVYRINTNGLDDPMEVALWLQIKQSEDVDSIKKNVNSIKKNVNGLVFWFIGLPILIWFIMVVTGTSILDLIFS